MLKVFIQHTNSRPRHLKNLIQNLDTRSYEVVTNNENSRAGMIDILRRKTMANHLLILQDDILPCKDLVATVQKLIELLPNQIISLFSCHDTSKPLLKKKHWLVMDRMWGACAYVLPRARAKELLTFNCRIRPEIYADDVVLSAYLKETGRQLWITAPSLVEHLAWHTTSQSDHKIPVANLKHRIAQNYIGLENSGLEIKWEKGLHCPERQVIGGNEDFIRLFNSRGAV